MAEPVTSQPQNWCSPVSDRPTVMTRVSSHYRRSRDTPMPKEGTWAGWRSAAPYRSSDSHIAVGKLCVRQAESEFKSRHIVVLTRIESDRVCHKTKLWRTSSKCLQSAKAPLLYKIWAILHPGVIDNITSPLDGGRASQCDLLWSGQLIWDYTPRKGRGSTSHQPFAQGD